jgi:hypothetical protein
MAMSRMRLPVSVYSQLGPVPVSLDDGIHADKKEPAFGLFSGRDRSIRVDSGSSPENQLATLMHEVVHLALFDAGSNNVLSATQAEVVCDAVGTYLAAAIVAGYLKVAEPKG